jgi:hypothetical protein
MLLSAVCFGMAGLTRELDMILFVVLVLPGVVLLTKRCQYKDGSRWIIPGIVFGAITVLFIGITLLFNQALTGNALITPRTLYSPVDHWGFGQFPLNFDRHRHSSAPTQAEGCQSTPPTPAA